MKGRPTNTKERKKENKVEHRKIERNVKSRKCELCGKIGFSPQNRRMIDKVIRSKEKKKS
jgi:hypothetical protein